VLAGLLLLWGVAGTIGNLVAGRLTDRFGSRAIINGAIVIVALDFALFPWTSTSLSTAVSALVRGAAVAGAEFGRHLYRRIDVGASSAEWPSHGSTAMPSDSSAQPLSRQRCSWPNGRMRVSRNQIASWS
jgi:MFS family permease